MGLLRRCVHARLDSARHTARFAVGRLLIATSPDPVMSSTASISVKLEKLIGSWAASEPARRLQRRPPDR